MGSDRVKFTRTRTNWKIMVGWEEGGDIQNPNKGLFGKQKSNNSNLS